MNSARKILLAGVIAAATSSFGLAVDATQTNGSSPAGAPAAAPATQPADPKIQALIDKLADPDPTARDSATKELEKIGRDALPQLKEQADSGNPEVRGRVRSLIRHAERRLPPAAPPHEGGGFSHSTRMSISNGKKSIEVDDNGYKIRIRQDEEGIKMDVTGVENGKEVTESYTAKDADQLKRDNPEAYALYDKYNGGGAGGLHIIGGVNGVQGNVQIQIQGGGAAGGVWVGGNGNAGGFGPGGPGGPGGMGFRRGLRPPNEPQQPLTDEQKKKVEEQLKQQNVPEEQQRLMREYLERIQHQQQDVQEQLQRQLEQEQRKALDDLKVPDREEKKDEKKAEEKEKK